MESKHKAIEEAYGEFYNDLKDFIDENGWCRNRKIRGFYNQLREVQNHPTINYWFRPLSLQGIENNNGWIKIESEDDLPKSVTDCWFEKKKDGDIEIGVYASHRLMFAGVDSDFSINEIVAFQPVTAPRKRIH